MLSNQFSLIVVINLQAPERFKVLTKQVYLSLSRSEESRAVRTSR